jgi:1-acyl-sn-glycerol-3-phosphate acyltransferase
MIKAAPKQWYKRLFYLYNRYYLLRRHFATIRLRGTIDPSLNNRRKPLLFVANHANWWDGMVAYDSYYPRSSYQHYIMMDEKQLRQFRFFTGLGVFSIDKTQGSAIIESLQYASERLQAGEAVWIFPQGEIAHLEKRPIQFSSGVSYLLEHCPQTVVVPVTLYYSFCQQQKPEASIWYGPALEMKWETIDRKERTKVIQMNVEHQLNQHRDFYMRDEIEQADFEVILQSKTTDEWFLSVKRWLKKWLTRSS